MGADIYSGIHSDPTEDYLSFYEIIKKGPPPPPHLEFVYRSCYGLNTDKESWKEYTCIINLDFWTQFSKYRTFPEKFNLDEKFGINKTIEGMNRLDTHVLLDIYSYF